MLLLRQQSGRREPIAATREVYDRRYAVRDHGNWRSGAATIGNAQQREAGIPSRNVGGRWSVAHDAVALVRCTRRAQSFGNQFARVVRAGRKIGGGSDRS